MPRRPRGADPEDVPAPGPLTVEELLARQGASVGRRAARRREASAPADPPRASRPGFPPVPGPAAAHAPEAQRGLPPVPPAPAGVRHSAPVPPLPGRRPDGEPGVRRSAPVPPLPGKRPVEQPGVRRSGPVPPLPGGGPAGSGRPTGGQQSRGRQRATGAPFRLAGRAARRATATPGRRRATRAVIALLSVVGLVALYALGLYFYVDRSITHVDALATDGPEILAPQLQAGTQNYLVVGTRLPGEKGPDSVATLLASVSADGKRAVLVSVPPTALVDTPECRTPGGRLREPTTEAFAASLLDGGPSCMVRAVQQLSGLRIDHYLDIDLSRLPGLVDALGGVPVCVLPSPAVAAAARPLPAGGSRLSGQAALQYLRPQDPAADVAGGLVAQRAQLLLTSTLRAAMSRSTWTHPVTLTHFLTDAADALTVDAQTTLGDLRALAGTLGSLPDGAVQRAQLPVAQADYVPAGSHTHYVLLDGGATRTLFDAVIDRTRLPAAAPNQAGQAAGDQAGDAGPGDATPAAADTAAPSPPPLTVPPSQVTLDVLNGTTTNGLAGTAADALRGQGFTVGAVGNAPAPAAQTQVRYGPGGEAQARTVAAAVPGAQLAAGEGLAQGAVQLVIGPGYSSVVPVQVPPPAAAVPSSAVMPSPTPAPAARC